MAVRKVAQMGHPVLRQVAKPVPESEIPSDWMRALLQDMLETMAEYDGRGLAAPQIHESLQVVVMLWDFEKEKEPAIRVLINPIVKALTQETSTFWEGCLSLPGLRGKVSRPSKIQVDAFDQQGQKLSFVAEGFAATVIQHECDHLLGKLYVDRITDMTSFAFTREYQRYFLDEGAESDRSEGE